MKKLQLLLLLLLVSASAFALDVQETSSHLGLGAGYSYYAITNEGNNAYYLYGPNITLKSGETLKGNDNLSIVTYLSLLSPTLDSSGTGPISFAGTTFMEDLSVGLTFSRFLSEKTTVYTSIGPHISMLLLDNTYFSVLTIDLGVFMASTIRTKIENGLYFDVTSKFNLDFYEFYSLDASGYSETGSTEDFLSTGFSINVGLTYNL